MKPKIFLLIPFIICAYGFLPVSFRFNKDDLKNPNHLLIQHQECGCPCPNAYVKEGQVIIPNNILNAYPGVDKKQINITGKDPFDQYDPDLAMHEMIITGEVVDVDTTLCTDTECQVVPVFKVDKWDIGSYYPRFWRHGGVFLLCFLVSTLLSGIIILAFVAIKIKKIIFNK